MSKQYNFTFPRFGFQPWDFADKRRAAESYALYMFNRTQSMFEWRGLPEGIPARMLELYLQMNGNACITHIDNQLRAFTGGLGGEPDIYYMPTQYVVANPRLDKSLNLEIDKECVVISNDSLYIGLRPLFSRYATALAENDLSMKLVDINTRVTTLISASDDKTAKSAEKYLQDLDKGKPGVIAENAFLDGIRAQPYAATNGNRITDLIEYQQYLKAGWFNELGLQANYNMKRESINSNEAQLNEDALLPLIDDMLKQRQLGAEKVNTMYGTNISVEYASSWKKQRRRD